MRRKLRCMSLLMFTVFLCYNVLISAVSAEEIEKTVIEMPMPQIALEVLNITDTSIELNWTSTEISLKNTIFDIYRDNVVLKTITGLTYSDTELAPEREYTYMVEAKDLYGNVIAKSNILKVVTTSVIIEQAISGSAITTDNQKNQQNKIESELILKNTKQKEILVKYRDESKADLVKNNLKYKLALSNIDIKKKLKHSKTEILGVDANADTNNVVDELMKDPNVQYAQPNYLLYLSNSISYETNITGAENTTSQSINSVNTLNDENSSVYSTDSGATTPGSLGIDTPDLQDLNLQPNSINPIEDNSSGGDGIIIGVLDTGIDINHLDLKQNIFVNEKEIIGNGIDDDGNGYIDDVNGWDFYNSDSKVFDNSITDEHGTHVAGIIAAEKNDVGITGVAPNSKILPLKFINGTYGFTSDAIEAIDYAMTMGVNIINCSWGGSEYNPALKDAMDNSGILFVCAAGNNGMNIDINPVYPAAFDSTNIITVTSVNKDGCLSDFSNYGPVSVDFAAPGEDVESTLPDNNYGQLSGTSVAAPYVSGKLANKLSNNQNIEIEVLKNSIISEFPKMSSLENSNIGTNSFGNTINIMSTNLINYDEGTSFNTTEKGIKTLYRTPGFLNTPLPWTTNSTYGNNTLAQPDSSSYMGYETTLFNDLSVEPTMVATPTSPSTKFVKVNSGLNTIDFSTNVNANEWCKLTLSYGVYTSNISTSNFKIKFSDGSKLYIKDAIDRGYLTKLTLLTGYYLYSDPNWINFYTSGNLASKSYPINQVVTKPLVYSITGVEFTSNKAASWGSYYDGFSAYKYDSSVQFSLSPISTQTPLKSTNTINCTTGNAINLIIKLNNSTDFSGRTFTLTYNTNDISNVTDLCKLTYSKELTAGNITGTGITITQVIPGIIKFTVNKSIGTGKSWSGIVNVIGLIPKRGGLIDFTCSLD